MASSSLQDVLSSSMDTFNIGSASAIAKLARKSTAVAMATMQEEGQYTHEINQRAAFSVQQGLINSLEGDCRQYEKENKKLTKQVAELRKVLQDASPGSQRLAKAEEELKFSTAKCEQLDRELTSALLLRDELSKKIGEQQASLEEKDREKAELLVQMDERQNQHEEEVAELQAQAARVEAEGAERAAQLEAVMAERVREIDELKASLAATHEELKEAHESKLAERAEHEARYEAQAVKHAEAELASEQAAKVRERALEKKLAEVEKECRQQTIRATRLEEQVPLTYLLDVPASPYLLTVPACGTSSPYVL